MARRSSTISRLRNLLLLGLVLALAAVTGLFLFGRAGQRSDSRPEEAATRAGQGTTLIGEDFDYTFTEGKRPIFRIRGDSIRADQAGTVFLDGVGVTLYDERGQAYHVESKQASFNRVANEGRLQGDVFLKGPGGLELHTAQLQIRDKGQLLFCPRQVEIRYAEQYVAHGQRLRVDLPAEVFVLQGRARVNSLPGAENPVAAVAQRAVYERQKRLLRIEGGAQLRRGRQRLQAQRITAFLSQDESSLVFVRALWNVKGQSARTQVQEGEPAALVRFSGRDLAVILQPQGNQVRKVDLEGSGRERVSLETAGGGVTRTLTAVRVEGILAEGVLSEAEAFGGVELRENVRPRPAQGIEGGVRQASGKRGLANFNADGQLVKASLFNEVVFQDPQVRAEGNRATLDLETDRAEFFGDPVDVKSEKGELHAPRIVYDTENQVVNAQGGVRAVLEQDDDASMASTPLAEGEGPVRVESREAFWRQNPSSFVFRGDVRSWRGENLMLSQELRGDQVQDRLTASGGVKTLWIPEQGAGGATAGETQASRAPIEVVASELIYEQGSRVLNYTGGVRIEQEGKTLQCQKVEVQLDEKRKPQLMTCSGQARLNDPKAGRNIEGETAVYRISQRQVEFTGAKVIMRDREGNQVQGRRVLYWIDDGKVEVKGKEGAAAGAG
ncbi:MAG TPA: LPS export ABC transporter periplasmic protein LptC [Thermoanaerobaculia bacterium]